MRSNLTKTAITKQPHVFCEIASDKRLELHTAEMVSDDAMYVTYTHKKDFVKEAPTTNLFVSLFTTSYARLRLYRYMRMVSDAPGCELLYTVSIPGPLLLLVRVFRIPIRSYTSTPKARIRCLKECSSEKCLEKSPVIA